MGHLVSEHDYISNTSCARLSNDACCGAPALCRDMQATCVAITLALGSSVRPPASTYNERKAMSSGPLSTNHTIFLRTNRVQLDASNTLLRLNKIHLYRIGILDIHLKPLTYIQVS